MLSEICCLVKIIDHATKKTTVISPNLLKLCGGSAFPKNVHTRKLGKITVFSAVCKKEHKMCIWQKI